MTVLNVDVKEKAAERRNLFGARLLARYTGIVFVVMGGVWQNYPSPSCPLLVTR